MPRPAPTTAPHHGWIRARWRPAVAFALSVALGFAGITAASAVADPPAPDEPPAKAAASVPRVVDFPMSLRWTDRYWDYGNWPTDGGPISLVIGPDTRTLVLDVDIESLGNVLCEFGDPDADDYQPMVTARWTAEQWSSDAPKTLAIPENLRGERYLRCVSGAAEPPSWYRSGFGDQQNWFIRWLFSVQPEGAGSALVLTNLEKDITSSGDVTHYNLPALPIPVVANDIVRIFGAPGTWPQDDNVRVSLINEPALGQAPTISVEGAVISADGSSVQFSMPVEPSPGFFGPNAILQVTAVSSGDGPPRYLNQTFFRAPLVLIPTPTPPLPVPVPVPIVDVTLSARYALSFQRRTVTAVVKTPGIRTPTGTVSFAVNGKPVGTAPLRADGRAAIQLPALERGRYSVTATFTPRNGTPSAGSPAAWLRVLL